MINKRVLLILGIVAILVASTALSGCIGGNKTTPTTPGATTTPTSSTSTSTGVVKPTVSISGNTITITGDGGASSKESISDPITLNKGFYKIKGAYQTNGYVTVLNFTDDPFSSLSSMQADLLGILTSGVKKVNTEDYSYASISTDGSIATAEVTAEGPWTLTVTKLDAASAGNLPLTINRKGSTVSDPVKINAGTVTLNLKIGSTLATNKEAYGVSMFNVETGDRVSLGYSLFEGKEMPFEATETVTIDEDGVYSVYVYGPSDADLTLTVSQ